MTTYKIESFNEEHLEDASRLFTSRYGIEREYTSLLPSRFENTGSISPLLEDLVHRSPGVVALRKHKLLGFLIGQVIPSWRGKRSIHVSEWAHSVAGKKRRKLFQRMYTQLSAKWVADGCFTHLVTVLAHDREMIDSLFWLGFGMVAVDALRGLHNVNEGGSSPDVEIRRAGLDDLELVTSLSAEFQRYMAGSPIYLAPTSRAEKEYHEKWLSNPSNALWLASQEGEEISYMKIGPFSEDAAYIISDEKTASITGAYTREHLRGKGIGTALLNQSLSWARSKGYERCAVDFEPENVLGSSFWLKHFKPICFSLIRQVDHRIAMTHKNRKDAHF